VNLAGAVAAAREADLWAAWSAVIVSQVLGWWLVSLLMQRSYVWFGAELRFADMFWVRGASYLLLLVHATLGQGALLLYQRGATGLTWPWLLGVVALRTTLSVASVVALLLPLGVALQLSGRLAMLRLPDFVVWLALVALALFVLDVWASLFSSRRFGVLARVLARFDQADFNHAFLAVRGRHALLVAALFVPQLLSTILGYAVLSHAFSVDVPWLEFFVLGPLLLVLLDLPIAFSGFGTATLAWITLFGSYGTTEQITALTLFLTTARLVIRVAIGGLSLPFALPALRAVGLTLPWRGRRVIP
jgi:hypothetical protein